MNVAILGAGGHGHDLADIAEACGDCGLLFDDSDEGLHSLRSSVSRYVSDFGHDTPYVVGVNDPSTRRRLAAGSNPTRLIHPAAVVSPRADLSPGVVVGAGTTVGPQVTLGPHVHVGAGCTITRTTVGAFTTISPGVDIAGDVTVGEECLIGVGATVSNLVTIGDRCTIGAGAVVIDDVPDDTTVVGVPAKPLQRGGTNMSKIIMGDKFVVQWAEALGLGDVKESKARRIVIDASVGQPLTVYVERYGTDAMLEITPPSAAEVEIREVS